MTGTTTMSTASVVEMAAALRRRATSATELARAALGRIRALDATLNAFVLVDAEGALAAAAAADAELATGVDRGPLHGIPVAVKDLIDVAGLPTTCGSASSFGTPLATADAEVVGRLQRAGAVLVGKTTLHELAYGATGDRSVHGPSRNPADPARISGGSSGGSAVAVAAGMVPLALGTDTAGSVRVPAALCGVVGLKPAFDAVPTAGVHPLAPTLDHVGLFARTAEDARIGYEVLAGAALEPQRWDGAIAWLPPADIAPTDPRVAALAHDALLRSGADVQVVPDALGAGSQLFRTFSTLQAREAHRVHAHHLADDEQVLDPEVRERLLAGSRIDDATYAGADRARREIRDLVGRLLDRHPVLALPTVPITAPMIDARTVHVGGRPLETRAALLSLTSPWNTAGVPAISVPAGHVDRMPVGVQLVAAAGDEGLLLRAAAAIETATDRAGRSADPLEGH